MWCYKSHHLAIRPVKVWKGGDSYVDCSSALYDYFRGTERGSRRRPKSCEHPTPPSSAERLWLNLHTPIPKHLFTSRWDSITLLRPSISRVMWKPATSICGRQCPSCPCIEHSVRLIPSVSSQLPDRSLARSPSLHLPTSSLNLTPSMARLHQPPLPSSVPLRSHLSHPENRGQCWSSLETPSVQW